MNTSKISRRSFLKGVGAVGTTSLLAACGGGDSTATSGAASGAGATAEGKVINIYSWNDEFRTRLEAVYPEVESTSDDGTVTTLKDGTEIHWIINPNQDGVYQQKLDEALLNQASAAADDKVDIFLSETDYVFKYTDAAADVAMPLTDLGIDPDTDLADQYPFTKTTASDANRSGHLRHRRSRGHRREGQGLGYLPRHRRGTEGQGLLCTGLLRRHLPLVRQQHQPALGR